jgi:RimJ/RimL family protein N-acetyltransferase
MTTPPAIQRADAPVAGGMTPVFRWLPIRSLAPRHRPRILDHLLALPERDRYLRFGQAASDAQIGRYVDMIDFDRDEVFGVFNRRVELVGMAHLAYLGSGKHARAAEFGVSVAGSARGRGFGARLFDHAVLHARYRRVDTLIVHALSENTAMLKIARHSGAVIEREGPESEARLRLPPLDLSSRLEVLLGGPAAELDYGFKVNARRVDRVIDLVAELRAGMSAAGRGNNG